MNNIEGSNRNSYGKQLLLLYAEIMEEDAALTSKLLKEREFDNRVWRALTTQQNNESIITSVPALDCVHYATPQVQDKLDYFTYNSDY